MSPASTKDTESGLQAEIQRLTSEIARLRKENDGLSDMVRATGGRGGGRSNGRFLLGVAAGIIIALVGVLMFFYQDRPIIRMF